MVEAVVVDCRTLQTGATKSALDHYSAIRPEQFPFTSLEVATATDGWKQDIQVTVRILSQKPEIAPTLLSVAKAVTTVECVEITIKMQAGKPVWVDSVKRERVG